MILPVDEVIAEHSRQLPEAEYLQFCRYAHPFLTKFLRKGPKWHSTYSLKQVFTSRIVYCYEFDFYRVCNELGFRTQLTDRGVPLVYAQWRKVSPLNSAFKHPAHWLNWRDDFKTLPPLQAEFVNNPSTEVLDKWVPLKQRRI